MFLSLVVSGAVSGAVYSLFAAGLVLTYTTSRVFNFAYGSIAFVSAFLFYQLNTGSGLDHIVAGVLTVLVFGPLLGIALEKVVFRRLRGADDSALIMATVGLSIALPAAALFIVDILVNNLSVDIPLGNDVVAPPGLGPSPTRTWRLGSHITISSDQVVILGAALACALVLWVLLNGTRIGLRMRAANSSVRLAELRGVNTARTSLIGWAVGSSFAALGGVVAAPLFALSSGSYTLALLVAATAAVLGRLRSVRLALIGGLALGIAQNLVAGYATFAHSITGFNTAVPFVLLFVGLLAWRGSDAERTARSGSAESAQPPPLSGVRLSARATAGLWVVFVVGVVVFASSFWLSIFAQGFAYCLIFLSLTVVLGIGGMVNLAVAAFTTLGALVFGLVASHGVPLIPALLCGVIAAMVAGAVVSLPAIRVSGLALALATLAMGLFGDEVLFVWDPLRNSDFGWSFTLPTVLGIDFSDLHVLCITLGVVVLAVCGLVRNLRNSPSGRAMLAVRSSNPGAMTAGISLLRTRTVIFVTSAAIAGFGGCLLALVNGSVTNNSTPALGGLTWVAAVVLFGSRSISGAVLAGLFFIVFPQVIGNFTSSTLLPQILFGLGAVALAKNPSGILADLANSKGASFVVDQIGGRLRRRPRRGDVGAPSVASAVVSEPLTMPADVDAATVPSGDAFLSVENLHAGYGASEVLRGVTFELNRGGALALIGPNGSGKSTLAGSLAGLVTAVSGRVVMDSRDLSGLAAHVRSRLGLCLIPESRGIFAGLSVEDNLALALTTDESALIFDRFPVLAARRRTAAGNLSGGEQQMLSLAPVLARPPLLFIADEPTLGLAPSIAEQVLQLLSELRTSGTTLILIEERPQELLDVVDQFILLTNGAVAMAGPVSSYSADRAIEEYFR